MTRHALVMLAGAVLIPLCMFYPVFPGDHDAMAVTLSIMARLFGIAGLLLVPIGLAWLVHEIRMHPDRASHARPYRGRWFGVASLVLATLVAAVMSLGALADHHASAGLIFLLAWIYAAIRLAGALRTRERSNPRTFNPAPLYLIVWPLVAVAFELTLMGPALESSRNRAIDESAELIAEIERYRNRHGRYPASLQSLWDDYRPAIVGVRRYHYEPYGSAYNVYFEHPARAFDIKEVVMYNPRDEQDFSSHNADLLQLAAADIAAQRGHVAVHQAPRPHWKYFLFD
ncbi:MAG TPA: hypothetical protein VIL35_00835 [Vicinamibacterales bacterium]